MALLVRGKVNEVRLGLREPGWSAETVGNGNVREGLGRKTVGLVRRYVSRFCVLVIEQTEGVDQ